MTTTFETNTRKIQIRGNNFSVINLTPIFSNDEYMAAKKAAEQANLTIYRIDQLESKVNKHNELIERTYALEKKAALYEEKMSVANHRIEDLEKRGEHHE